MFSFTNKNIIYIDKNTIEYDVESANKQNVQYSLKSEKITEEITRHTLSYTNYGTDIEIIPVFCTELKGSVDFYIIPCVNYNGNFWGNGKEPKGMTYEGNPWVFPAERTGLPGGAYVEVGNTCKGVFAGNDKLSANASSSIFEKDGKVNLRIYFSNIEYPRVFLRKFEYSNEIINFISIKKGESKTFVCYEYDYKTLCSNYGYMKMFDYINNEYLELPYCKFSPMQIKEYSMEYIRTLVEQTEFGYLSNMGMLPGGEHRIGDKGSQFIYRKFGKYEIGWCGQNITVAEMYIRQYLETGNHDDLDIGTGIIDTWLTRQYPSGLISVNFDGVMKDDEYVDSCNEGWFIYKLIKCLELLKRAGLHTEKYENAVKGMCEYYINNFPHDIFPQVVMPNGECYIEDGFAGAMCVVGFLEAYKYFGDERYITRAISGFDFYYNNYLTKSISAGGALDTYCIDKESSGPILRSALLLKEITNDDTYLEKAEKIAHYLMTWCFYYDVDFEEGTDCYNQKLKTSGGTSVSTCHHHIDCWGLFYAPDMYQLYKLTKNEGYKRQALALWMFTVQYISDGTLCLHDMIRPKGSQNEAVIQCNWHGSDESRGQLNDWLVVWVKTFQLDCFYALKDTDFYDNIL